MADKVVAIKIDVQGTADQKRKLEGLEKTLQGLTEQQRKLKKQLKDGAITRDQYAKSIAKVNLGLKGTRRELLVTRQAMLGIDGFTTKLGKSFARLGTSISGAFIGLFAVQKLFELFKTGLDVNKEFEKSISELSAITGQSGKELDKLSDAARRMGKETTKSAVEVAQAFTVVGSKRPELLKNADALIEVTEAAILLSEAAGIAVPDAAQAVTLALNQFGPAAGGAAKVIDVLAAASVEGSVLIPQLAEELSKFGGIAKKSGLSVAQAAASVEVVGKTVEQSGTKLRNILIKLESGTENFRPSVVGLNTALDNLAKEGFTSIPELAKKFGRQNAEAALSVIQNRSEVARLTKALDVNGIALRQSTTMTDNLDGAQKRLGSAFDELYLTIGSGSEGGALTTLVDDVAEGVNSFSNWANETNLFTELFRVFINTAKLASTPLIILFDVIKSITGEFESADSSVGGFTKGLRIFSSVIETYVGGIKTFISTIVSAFKIVFLGIETVLNATKVGIGAIANGFNGLGKIIKAVANRDFSDIPKIVKKTFSDSLKAVDDFSDKTADSFGKTFNEAGKVIVDFKNDTVKNFSDALDEEAILEAKQAAKQKTEKDKILKADQKALEEKKKAEQKSFKEKKELAKKIAAGDKKLAEQVRKLKQDQLVLEIEDKRKAEFQKLTFSEQNAIREVELTISTEEQKRAAILAIQTKFNAQRQALAKKNADKDAKKVDDDAKKLEKEATKAKDKEDANQLKKDEEKKVFEAQVLSEKIDLAEQTANALVDVTNRKIEREKDIELTNLNAKLQQGLISQEDFEKKKEDIERKAFNKQKKLEIAQIAISLAREIASIAANSAGNPLNAFTGGGAGAIQNKILAGLAIARSGIQAGIIASQSFAEGGYTGGGVGTPDATGFRQAGVVHEGEYVVPKNVLESNGGSRLVGALESMRNNRPQPYLGAGFANGGFSSGGGNLDINGLRDEISSAVISSIGSIQVVNVATETTTQANRVNNIQSEATFG